MLSLFKTPSNLINSSFPVGFNPRNYIKSENQGVILDDLLLFQITQNISPSAANFISKIYSKSVHLTPISTATSLVVSSFHLDYSKHLRIGFPASTRT